MANSHVAKHTRSPLISAGTTLGIGLGGFADGIVMHQILQLHNMMSAKYPTKGVDAETLIVNLEVNMFWDGIFHAGTWIVTAVGLGMLWGIARRSDVPRSGITLFGSMILGWGLFNLVEGIIDHHILQLHHVVESPNHLVADLSFLASGLVMLLLGLGLIWAGRDDLTSRQV
jgi:uncharacterized membrane protein